MLYIFKKIKDQMSCQHENLIFDKFEQQTLTGQIIMFSVRNNSNAFSSNICHLLYNISVPCAYISGVKARKSDSIKFYVTSSSLIMFPAKAL